MTTSSGHRMKDLSIHRTERRERPLARLAELFGRRATPSYRMAPPLRNPHYVGLHIAVASSRTWSR